VDLEGELLLNDALSSDSGYDRAYRLESGLVYKPVNSLHSGFTALKRVSLPIERSIKRSVDLFIPCSLSYSFSRCS
jgi:hypothetical protein